MPSKKGYLLLMGKIKIKADLENSFEPGEVITLWMVYQYSQSLQRYRRPSQLSCQRGRKPLMDFTTRPVVNKKKVRV